MENLSRFSFLARRVIGRRMKKRDIRDPEKHRSSSIEKAGIKESIIDYFFPVERIFLLLERIWTDIPSFLSSRVHGFQLCRWQRVPREQVSHSRQNQEWLLSLRWMCMQRTTFPSLRVSFFFSVHVPASIELEKSRGKTWRKRDEYIRKRDSWNGMDLWNEFLILYHPPPSQRFSFL